MASQMKHVWGLFWAKQLRLLQIAPMGAEAHIPRTQQPMGPLCRDIPGPLPSLWPSRLHTQTAFI
jgi:hypothetical protein